MVVTNWHVSRAIVPFVTPSCLNVNIFESSPLVLAFLDKLVNRRQFKPSQMHPKGTGLVVWTDWRLSQCRGLDTDSDHNLWERVPCDSLMDYSQWTSLGMVFTFPVGPLMPTWKSQALLPPRTLPPIQVSKVLTEGFKTVIYVDPIVIYSLLITVSVLIYTTSRLGAL